MLSANGYFLIEKLIAAVAAKMYVVNKAAIKMRAAQIDFLITFLTAKQEHDNHFNHSKHVLSVN